MSAAENGQHEMCRWLIGKGADVKAKVHATGWTAAHAASKNSDAKSLQVLLEAGADPLQLAAHRDFGRQLAVADVTKDPATQEVLRRSY